MVALPRKKSTQRNPNQKRIAGVVFKRMPAKAVEALWTELAADYEIIGRSCPDDTREIATAVPRRKAGPDDRCWIGYTLDGRYWWGGYAFRKQASAALAQCIREVLA